MSEANLDGNGDLAKPVPRPAKPTRILLENAVRPKRVEVVLPNAPTPSAPDESDPAPEPDSPVLLPLDAAASASSIDTAIPFAIQREPSDGRPSPLTEDVASTQNGARSAPDTGGTIEEPPQRPLFGAEPQPSETTIPLRPELARIDEDLPAALLPTERIPTRRTEIMWSSPPPLPEPSVAASAPTLPECPPPGPSMAGSESPEPSHDTSISVPHQHRNPARVDNTPPRNGRQAATRSVGRPHLPSRSSLPRSSLVAVALVLLAGAMVLAVRTVQRGPAAAGRPRGNTHSSLHATDRQHAVTSSTADAELKEGALGLRTPPPWIASTAITVAVSHGSRTTDAGPSMAADPSPTEAASTVTAVATPSSPPPSRSVHTATAPNTVPKTAAIKPPNPDPAGERARRNAAMTAWTNRMVSLSLERKLAMMRLDGRAWTMAEDEAARAVRLPDDSRAADRMGKAIGILSNLEQRLLSSGGLSTNSLPSGKSLPEPAPTPVPVVDSLASEIAELESKLKGLSQRHSEATLRRVATADFESYCRFKTASEAWRGNALAYRFQLTNAVARLEIAVNRADQVPRPAPAREDQPSPTLPRSDEPIPVQGYAPAFDTTPSTKKPPPALARSLERLDGLLTEYRTHSGKGRLVDFIATQMRQRIDHLIEHGDHAQAETECQSAISLLESNRSSIK